MNKIKLDYLQPGCKILVVRFEEGILSTSNNTNEVFSGQRTVNGVWNIDEDE